MIKLDGRGRRANNEEMAEIFHSMNPGDVINVYGAAEEAKRLANSLSRTHKAHNKSRFAINTMKTGGVTITCIKACKPKTIIVI